MDGIKKFFLAGLGALSLSKEKAQNIVAELVKQGKLKEKEGKILAEEMFKKAKETKQNIQKTVNTTVASVYARVNLATQKQLNKMEARLQALENKKGPKAGSKKATKSKTKTKKKSTPVKKKY